jgi:hypothetical protein
MPSHDCRKPCMAAPPERSKKTRSLRFSTLKVASDPRLSLTDSRLPTHLPSDNAHSQAGTKRRWEDALKVGIQII